MRLLKRDLSCLKTTKGSRLIMPRFIGVRGDVCVALHLPNNHNNQQKIIISNHVDATSINDSIYYYVHEK